MTYNLNPSTEQHLPSIGKSRCDTAGGGAGDLLSLQTLRAPLWAGPAPCWQLREPTALPITPSAQRSSPCLVLVSCLITLYDFSILCSLAEVALDYNDWLMQSRKTLGSFLWSFLVLTFLNLLLYLLVFLIHSYASICVMHVHVDNYLYNYPYSNHSTWFCDCTCT